MARDDAPQGRYRVEVVCYDPLSPGGWRPARREGVFGSLREAEGRRAAERLGPGEVAEIIWEEA
ncbi:MAG: hypothetical protein K6U87_06135 [Firmicutes bacterium]|nr:hypothetical protein [Bacillota bacterium]